VINVLSRVIARRILETFGPVLPIELPRRRLEFTGICQESRMKTSFVALVGCATLILLPMAAFAVSHASSTPGASIHVSNPKPCPSLGVKYGTSPYTNTFSSFLNGDRSAVNCAVDRQCRLLQLRNQGLALKEKDGGKLTAAHRAELQAQLDSINGRSH
jgi:hypothetical protein